MASKKTLNAKNLEALGAARLVELLLEVSGGDAVIKRRLRLELAAATSPADAANEIRKRLTTIARAHSFIDWPKRKAFIADLEAQRRAIAGKVADADPVEALDLLWRFMALTDSVFGRCDDSDGAVGDVFRAACDDLGTIAAAAKPDPIDLADRAFGALCENNYGEFDDLIDVLEPVLGTRGLDHLKNCFVELSKSPISTPRQEDREVIGWGSGGAIYADDRARHHRDSTVRLALQQIADAQGDVDAFIAQQSDKARTVPRVAAEIAHRLLQAGRAEEAWKAINAVSESRPGWIPPEWQKVRLMVMEALGRDDEAQAFRWECFERGLDASHLHSYLKRLPDFDDLKAEEQALAIVRASKHFHEALAFLVKWPAHELAADLVLTRSAELNGDLYEFLGPAAAALTDRHPLAATLLLRAMIDFSLGRARSSRYRHAARHLMECERLSHEIVDFGTFEPHHSYQARLQAEHGRKSSFWNLLA